MIVSIIDIHQDIATREKLIFPSAITHILTHMHILIPSAPLFSIMGAISQGFIWRSDTQMAFKAKWPREEFTSPNKRRLLFELLRILHMPLDPLPRMLLG